MHFIITIGVPGSGKSTWCNEWQEANPLNALFPIYTIINPDLIRKELTGDISDQSRNKEVFETAYRRLNNVLERERSVIFDSTAAKPSYRKKLIEIGKQHTTRIKGYYFKTPLEVCLERNAARDRQVPEFIIRNMYQNLNQCPPRLEEGFDDLIIIE